MFEIHRGIESNSPKTAPQIESPKSSTMTSSINPKDLQSFTTHLRASDRILALCGAGLSASSGLPTFRGAGGYWRKHDATQLATPGAFEVNPSLVWQFYSYRRHMALNVKPNAAHYALTELARKKENFLTLTQNVDGEIDNSGRWNVLMIFRIECSRWS